MIHINMTRWIERIKSVGPEVDTSPDSATNGTGFVRHQRHKRVDVDFDSYPHDYLRGHLVDSRIIKGEMG